MIDTTGKCSACGQTVGIDTIHTCSPQVTAPTPERRVGEAEARIWCSSLEPAVRDLARDLLDERAAVARLTAEVERLREIAEEAINAARLAWHEGYDDAVDPAWSEKQLRYAKVDAEPHEIKAVTHFFGVSDTKAWVEELSARLAALSLPTPAPEARK